MAEINLHLLARCDNKIQRYNMLCVETSAESGMSSQDAWDVYNLENMPAEFESEIFKKNMEVLDTGAIRCLSNPFSQNGFTVFHLSNGEREKDSASIFIRLFAVPAPIVQLGNGCIEVNEICHIAATDNKGVNVAMKLSNGTRQNDIKLNESNMTITWGEKQYEVYYDVVGMGYHVGSKGYKFIRYNKKVFPEGKFMFEKK